MLLGTKDKRPERLRLGKSQPLAMPASRATALFDLCSHSGRVRLETEWQSEKESLPEKWNQIQATFAPSPVGEVFALTADFAFFSFQESSKAANSGIDSKPTRSRSSERWKYLSRPLLVAVMYPLFPRNGSTSTARLLGWMPSSKAS